MRRLDRYVLTEMIPPFLFGVAAFMAVLMGIGALYEMLRGDAEPATSRGIPHHGNAS